MLSAGAVLLVPCTVRRGIGEAKRLLQNLRHRRAGVCSVLPWPQNLREARSFPCTPSELRREGSSRQAALVMWAQNVSGTLSLQSLGASRASFSFLQSQEGSAGPRFLPANNCSTCGLGDRGQRRAKWVLCRGAGLLTGVPSSGKHLRYPVIFLCGSLISAPPLPQVMFNVLFPMAGRTGCLLEPSCRVPGAMNALGHALGAVIQSRTPME